MAITIKLIAQKSGFSASTVSHAISGRNPGKRSLSPETINKIRAVAQEMGYRPNLLAAGLAQSKTYAIGVLVALLRGDFYERILEAITEVVWPEFSPLLAVHNYDLQRERREIDLFLGKRVDGVIAACSGREENIEAYQSIIKNYSMPLVFVDRGLNGVDCPVVRGDHEKTAFLAAHELQKLGHKRIIYATAGAKLESTELFKDGYRKAMGEAGLEPIVLHPDLAVWNKQINRQLAADVVDQVRRGDGPTAVVCQVDWLAYDVLAQCELHGLKVPDDVSVMGLQDCEPSALPAISLSTIRVSFEDVGRQAASVLLKLINGEDIGRQTFMIEPSVIMRGTTRAI
ncbi:MAG: hypothetical protein A2Y12_02605 [Planctomycetes bacterium GWF2_42_9]|nr:MAG: hypothetical protein A2Y12_02605 [Planctomycetes bacterium GWF2_42_9]